AWSQDSHPQPRQRQWQGGLHAELHQPCAGVTAQVDERGKPAPGGEPQEPAIGGGSPCPVPKTSLPASTCATSNGGKFPYIDFRSASAVANSGLTLFATQTADHIAAVAWQPIADTGQTFTRWACFDYVPHIH